MAIRLHNIWRLAALLALLVFVAVAGRPTVHALSEYVSSGDPVLGQVALRPEVSGLVTLKGIPAAGIEISIGRARTGGPPCGAGPVSVVTNSTGRFYIPELRGRKSDLTAKELENGQTWTLLCIGPRGATVPDILFVTSVSGEDGRRLKCNLPRPSPSAYDPRACR